MKKTRNRVGILLISILILFSMLVNIAAFAEESGIYHKLGGRGGNQAYSFSTVEECARFLKENIKKQITKVGLVYTPATGTANDASDVFDSILSAVYTQDGSAAAGDYLRYQVSGVSANIRTVTEGRSVRFEFEFEIEYFSSHDGTAIQSNTFSTLAECGNYLRESIKNRKTKVEFVYVPMNGMRYSTSDLFDTWVSAAYAHTGNPEEGDYIRYQVSEISANTTSVSIGNTVFYRTVFSIDYLSSYEEEAWVSKYLSAIMPSLTAGSDRDTLFNIYSYICDNVSYDYAHKDDLAYTKHRTAYGALHDGTAVCQGYAVLLYRMLLAAGIDTRVISGIGESEPHAWNIAELDGSYYNLDATWDAGNSEWRFYIKGEAEFPDHTRDAEYSAYDFAAQYPMARYEYTWAGSRA